MIFLLFLIVTSIFSLASIPCLIVTILCKETNDFLLLVYLFPRLYSPSPFVLSICIPYPLLHWLRKQPVIVPQPITSSSKSTQRTPTIVTMEFFLIIVVNNL